MGVMAEFQNHFEMMDSEKRRSRLIAIQGGRLAFLVAILTATLLFQANTSGFFSTEVLVPLYLLAGSSFLVSAIYLWSMERVVRSWGYTGFLFAFDAFIITSLIYYTGIDQSIFIFLYLVNIIFCGFVFQKRGAFFLALVTSSLFSLLFILRPQVTDDVVYFSLGLNNLGFFAVAFLSGYLSEQVNFMGVELKARDRDLAALQDLHKLIVENMTSGLMTIDLRGVILQSNPAAARIIDSSALLDGANLNDVLPGVLQTIIKTDRAPGSDIIGRFEFNHINSRGEKVLIGFGVSPLRKDSEEYGFTLILQDLTEVKRFELALRRSEKLAAVGALAAGIAHEIRNPLASISGSVQLLRAMSHGGETEEARLMSIMIKEIDRLNNLITEFLDYVRPDHQMFGPVDVNEVLSQVLEMARLNGNVRSDVSQSLDVQTHKKILGSRDKLIQVFLNLVINAYQAMDKTEKPQLRVRTELKNGAVVVRIKDNGPGMNEAVQKRLFEPFHTTKPKGTGLGLATVHKILENHEARIFVESEPGLGAEFIIEFSRLENEAAPAKPGEKQRGVG